MTIAGSDSGGGAGIQADLKTFSAFGVFGTSVITALTAQNTKGVSAIHAVPPSFVAEQYDQVFSDIGADAAKTGMLANEGIIRALSEALSKNPPPHLVVDPVMISKAGAALLEPDAVSALIECILPLATLVTPNLHEAAAITGADEIRDVEEMALAAERIRALGPGAVLVKGGHLAEESEAVDLFYDGSKSMEFRAERLDQKHTHGTGCTYSAAIAACLAKGIPLLDSVGKAKGYITEAIRTAPGIGGGVGPLNHFVSPPHTP
jgi:hydroxymethylpyrimidine/phosphomethylpyrimidine kinase